MIPNFLKRKNKKETKKSLNIKDWYELVPIAGGEPTNRGRLAVKIEKGPYKDLVIKFGAVSVKPGENKKERSTIRYEYDMIYIPKHLEGKELTDEEDVTFHNFLGDVLSDLIAEAFKGQSKEVIAEMIEEAEVKNSKEENVNE
jgi:hypothetical protein